MAGKTKEYLADLSLIFISLIWGSTFIIVKEALENIDVFKFLTLRFGLASILMLVFVIKKFRDVRRSFIPGVILGLVLFSIFALQTLGLKYTLASIAGFLTGLYVVFVPFLSIILLKQFPRKASIVGVFLAFFGLMLISYNGGDFEINIGIIYLILNAFFIGLHIIMIDKYSKIYDVTALTFIQLTVVFLLSLLFSLFFTDNSKGIILNSNVIFAVILTGVFATVVAFFVQTAMQKYTTPTKAAVIFTFEPVSSAFFGYFIGKEILTLHQYIGSALIVFSIIVSEVGSYIFKGESDA
ncbi:DMT family transporter [Deferribacter autotrophicus]|uniref:DMT family transporter n=1 Tax=Deferribacter autotrophicus TaxID=500465 RepID=A0A5A8F4B1_9BACT|nr:DMT family transporter [Deferribacter autotrophicus]KAA0258346.1 DMT family transporter [Deferribacter autotrophicus]